MDSSVGLFKCNFICHLFLRFLCLISELFIVQVSSATVLESGFVTHLHLCVSQIYPSVFALLEPRRKLLYNHLWRGVIHPEPQRVWPTQFLVMMITLGLVDVMVMTLMMIMVIIVRLRFYTKKLNLDNCALGSCLCEAYLNPCNSVSTWIAKNQFGSKLGHDICKLERHMQPLLAP